MGSFEETLIMVSSSFPNIQQEHEDGFHKIRTSLSRLSICTTTSVHDNNKEVVEEDREEHIKNQTEFVSENFDADADGEVSDDTGGRRGKENVQESDSDNFYSLPATQSRRRKKVQVSDGDDGKKCNLRRQRRVNKEKKKSKNKKGDDGGVGLTVLTRAKGGENSLMMGLEEVKACRDLGFDLEVPGRISVSTGSNFDTQTSSSGCNSPIAATWRISSPGDDPKEVKARLKVWAQAVALASTSRQA